MFCWLELQLHVYIHTWDAAKGSKKIDYIGIFTPINWVNPVDYLTLLL